MTSVAVDPDSAPLSPDQVLARWGVSGRELFDAFVLDRAPEVRGRLTGRARLIGTPYERVGILRPRDVLVRGVVGENRVLVAVLVDGVLLDAAEAGAQGWQVESAGPGCFAWVVEDEPIAHPRDDRWARRVTDADGFVTAGQAVVRPTDVMPAASWGFDPTESVVPVLRSVHFSGDDTLNAVAAGELRLAAVGTSPHPAPIVSSGPPVAKVQQALIDLDIPLPQYGADGSFGSETGAAVSKFKASRNIQPTDPVVGRATIAALDAELLAREQPNPSPPQPDPRPLPPPDPAPSPPTGPCQPGDHLWHYRGQTSPKNDIPCEWFPNATKKERYEGHGDEITHYVLHSGDQVYCGQPHMNGRPGTWAWLNNNPGNITRGGINLGQYPNKVSWHDFLIFPSYEVGFKAIAEFMRNGRFPKSALGPADYYHNVGITDAFRHYAPRDDGNDPERYGREVAEALGVPETTRVGDLDEAQMLRMQQKIQQIEGTRKGRILPRDHPDLPTAVRAALS